MIFSLRKTTGISNLAQSKLLSDKIGAGLVRARESLLKSFFISSLIASIFTNHAYAEITVAPEEAFQVAGIFDFNIFESKERKQSVNEVEKSDSEKQEEDILEITNENKEKSIGDHFNFSNILSSDKEEAAEKTTEDEAANKEKIDTRHEIEDVAYGEILYDYFGDNNKDAIVKILVEKQRDSFEHQKDHAELLLGQLYIIYGLPKKAEEIFLRLSKSKISSETKNQALFQLVRIYSYQGKTKEAKHLLTSEFKNLSTAGEVERRVLLANIHAENKDYDSVKSTLKNIPRELVRDTYLKYNLASANILAGESTYALPILKDLAAGQVSNLEGRALRDKANLTLGSYYIKQEKYTEAQEHLSAVSYEGPHSAAALYYLGWVKMKSEDEKVAFPLWIDLSQRNPADPYVEQSYLARPYIYEKLNSSYQALDGYLRASKIYKTLITDVEKTQEIIRSPAWLEKLQPKSIDSLEMYETISPVPGWIQTQNNEINFLHKLYSSDRFNTIYQNYWELELLKQDLVSAKTNFEVYKFQESTHKDKFTRIIPEANRQLESEEITKAKERFAAIKSLVDNIVVEKDFYAMAEEDQLVNIERIKHIEGMLSHLPKDSYKTQRNYLRLLKGVNAWNMSQDANHRQWKVKFDYKELEKVYLLLEKHEKGILQGIEQENRYKDFSMRIETLDAAIDASLNELELLTLKHQRLMRNLALNHLEDRKKFLKELIVKSQLAAARLQDNVATGGK